MSAIQNFAFEEHLVRVVERDGEPWFVGKDVCAALALKNHNDALSSLDEDEKGVANTDPLYKTERGGGAQETIIISEPGVYRLVFRSRKEEAERFKRWLAHDVLPQIRRTGQYRAAEPPASSYEEPLVSSQRVALAMVTEARMIYGAARARALWETLPTLPAVPPSATALTAMEEGVPAQVLDCLEHLMGWPADDDMRSIGELLKADDETAREALETIGIRKAAEGLWIAAGKPQMRALWEKTRWRDGLWVSLIKRLPGVTGGHERITIGGYQCRPIWFPLAALS